MSSADTIGVVNAKVAGAATPSQELLAKITETPGRKFESIGTIIWRVTLIIGVIAIVGFLGYLAVKYFLGGAVVSVPDIAPPDKKPEEDDEKPEEKEEEEFDGDGEDEIEHKDDVDVVEEDAVEKVKDPVKKQINAKAKKVAKTDLEVINAGRKQGGIVNKDGKIEAVVPDPVKVVKVPAKSNWSEWSEWSKCKSCGGGHQSRTRSCTEVAGGGSCKGDGEEKRECANKPCGFNAFFDKDYGDVEFPDAGIEFEENKLLVFNQGRNVELVDYNDLKL